MLLRVTALAAAAAASAPPFVTAAALRPARRAQDFAECPVLTKIKKDDCTDVKDFDALPVSRNFGRESANSGIWKLSTPSTPRWAT